MSNRNHKFLIYYVIHATFLLIISVIAAVPPSEEQDDGFFNTASSTELIRGRFVWTIKNLHFNDYEFEQRLVSSQFSAGPNTQCQWNLWFYPKGLTQKWKNYVGLYLNPKSCNNTADFRLGFININDEPITYKKFPVNFSQNVGYPGFPNFVEQDLLINEKNGFFVNHTLIIFCEVVITLNGETISKKLQKLPRKDDIGKDLAFLLENELFSDVIVTSSGRDFQAHKAILAARCPFFKTLLEQDSQGVNISRVNLTEVDYNVVKEMLRYIYTGEVSNLDNLAPDLLAAAEKYELIGLKTICEDSISSNLTIENAVQFYVLGDTYSAAYLKDQAKHFIVAQASDVILTPGFKSIIQTHPLLVEELFSAVIETTSRTI